MTVFGEDEPLRIAIADDQGWTVGNWVGSKSSQYIYYLGKNPPPPLICSPRGLSQNLDDNYHTLWMTEAKSEPDVRIICVA